MVISLYCACWCWSLDVFLPGGRHQWWNRLCGTHEGIARWKLLWQRGLIALHSDCTWSKAASATEPLSDQSLPTWHWVRGKKVKVSGVLNWFTKGFCSCLLNWSVVCSKLDYVDIFMFVQCIIVRTDGCFFLINSGRTSMQICALSQKWDCI